MKSGLIILALCLAINALHVQHQSANFPTGQVELQSDNGKFLARCNGCGPSANPDVAGVHADQGEGPYQIWTVQIHGSQVAFKSDTGKYLGRCNGCWQDQAYPDSAQVHVDSPSQGPWALWTPELKANGKWAFKSDNGNYLARCNNCVSEAAYSDLAFVHQADSNNPWAQWQVIPA